MSNIGEKLKQARKARRMSQKELSKLSGFSTVSISKWENGSAAPNLSSIIRISDILDIPLGDIAETPKSIAAKFDLRLRPEERTLVEHVRKLQKDDQRIVYRIAQSLAEAAEKETCEPSRTQTADRRLIAVYLSPAAAGISAPIEGSEFEMVGADHIPDGADIGVRIQGDSMEPYIDDGAVVYVSKTAEIQEGDIGIFCVDGSMYCKQFHREADGTVILLSANPERAMSNVVLRPDSSSTLTAIGKVLMPRIPLPDYFDA